MKSQRRDRSPAPTKANHQDEHEEALMLSNMTMMTPPQNNALSHFKLFPQHQHEQLQNDDDDENEQEEQQKQKQKHQEASNSSSLSLGALHIQSRSPSSSSFRSWAPSPKQQQLQLQQQEEQHPKEEKEEKNNNNQDLLYPLNKLPERFSNVKFLASGGYGKVFSATDLHRLALDGRDTSVAVKVLEFICDHNNNNQEDIQRFLSLGEYGDLATLLPGQDYVPLHIRAELTAHNALNKDVKGTMQLRRVEVWAEQEEEEQQQQQQKEEEEEKTSRKCFVMLVLPLLTPLRSDFFVRNNNQQQKQQQKLLDAVKQISQTLSQMHKRFYCHRDLSLQNIFLHQQEQQQQQQQQEEEEEQDRTTAIIGDFGLAAFVGRFGRASSGIMQLYAGKNSYANTCTTIWYRSPEMLAQQQQEQEQEEQEEEQQQEEGAKNNNNNNNKISYSFEQDAWSLGVVACELSLGFPLFPGENIQEQISLIQDSHNSTNNFFNKMIQLHQERFGSSSSSSLSEKIIQAASTHLLCLNPQERSIEKFLAQL